MRTTQFIGHTNKVSMFLSICTQGKYLDVVKGMFEEDVYSLHQYIDIDGHIWNEFVQACPWSSGPMIFLGIRREDNSEIMGWTQLEDAQFETVNPLTGEFYV